MDLLDPEMNMGLEDDDEEEEEEEELEPITEESSYPSFQVPTQPVATGDAKGSE